MPNDQRTTSNPIEKRFEHVTRYHYLFFALYFSCRFPSIWHLINFVFLSPPMSFTCGTNGTTTRTEKNQCPCENPVWDLSVFTKTVQTKYGIICEKAWLISLSETLSVFGILVSSFISGYISDTYGRLLTLSLSAFVLATSGCLVSIMPTITTFICMRFIEGCGIAGVIVSGYVLCIEYCGVKYRETISALLHIPINLGHMALAGVSYLLRDCDQFQLAISIPMFYPILFWWILLESPKWLLDNNHRERAITVMEKFCRFNKGPNCENVRGEIEAFQSAATTGQTLKFYQIFKHKALAKNLFYMSFLFFTCGIGYYGVTQMIGKMSGNIHLNTVIGGSFLVPGSLLSVVFLNKLGRKTFLISVNIFTGTFILLMVAIPVTFKPAWVRILCAGLANSGFYVCFIVVFLYCVELFPTSARNSALGFLSVVSRIGQMSGPQINRLSVSIAGITFGVLALFSVLVITQLPETKGRELPSGIGDIPVGKKAARSSSPPPDQTQNRVGD